LQQKPFYKSDTWTLQPGQGITISRSADFLACFEADAEFTLQIDNSPETSFAKGLTFEAQTPFLEVRIFNNTAHTNTITLGFGRGGIRDNRLVLEGASIASVQPAGEVFEVRQTSAGRQWVHWTEKTFIQGSRDPFTGLVDDFETFPDDRTFNKIAIHNQQTSGAQACTVYINGFSGPMHRISVGATVIIDDAESINRVRIRPISSSGISRISMMVLESDV